MNELTSILKQIGAGRDEALGEAFERVYAELRRLAASRLAVLHAGQTLTPTVLVHEVYEKLLRAESLGFEDRQHFFACAARAMRQIVLDHARASCSEKRGGKLQRTQFDEDAGYEMDQANLLDMDLALQRLGEIDEGLLRLVELRYFAGLGLDEIASLWRSSRRTLNREWQRARLLLHGLMQESGGPNP